MTSAGLWQLFKARCSPAPVYLLAAVRAILGMKPDSRPTEKRGQRWFSLILIPQICVFGALGGTLVFTALRGGESSVVAALWAAVMAFLLAGPLTAVNARPALERLLRGTIRGGIVLIAAFRSRNSTGGDKRSGRRGRTRAAA